MLPAVGIAMATISGNSYVYLTLTMLLKIKSHIHISVKPQLKYLQVICTYIHT